MLTHDEINSLRDQAGQMTNSATEYIIEDICRRIAKTGRFTRSADYLQYRAQTLGVGFDKIMREVSRRLGMSVSQIQRLYNEAAKTTYDSDAKRLVDEYQPFEENASLQQIVKASAVLAEKDFTNITQTLGMVAPGGEDLPLKQFYRATMDWVFNKVSLGVMDYNTAIRKASAAFVDSGLTAVRYESGVVTTIEAAVRRNIMGGLGLMVERVSQYNHDTFGANGWEISAHANSAPDHEDIQGKQYTDAEFEALNGRLQRRISTLNCTHFAFPVIIGVNAPQRTKKQLEKLKTDNAEGITIEGKHYTGYKATQRQRALERIIRKWKKRNLAANATGDEEETLRTAGKLNQARRAYSKFSEAAGIRTQSERAYVAGFGRKEAAKARADSKKQTQ